jgi:hypothetical protein
MTEERHQAKCGAAKYKMPFWEIMGATFGSTMSTYVYSKVKIWYNVSFLLLSK